MPLPVVLCVDDEPSLLRSLKQELDLGLSGQAAIETATSGEEALEVLAELAGTPGAVAVLITDQLMPGLKGDELVTTVHAEYPTVRSILLTGQASADAVGRALNQGRLFRFFAKPWDAPALRDAVLQGLAEFAAAQQQAQQLRAWQQAHQYLAQLTAAPDPRTLSETLATALAPTVDGLWLAVDGAVLHATPTTCRWIAPEQLNMPARAREFPLGGGALLWLALRNEEIPTLLSLLLPVLPQLYQLVRRPAGAGAV